MTEGYNKEREIGLRTQSRRKKNSFNTMLCISKPVKKFNENSSKKFVEFNEKFSKQFGSVKKIRSVWADLSNSMSFRMQKECLIRWNLCQIPCMALNEFIFNEFTTNQEFQWGVPMHSSARDLINLFCPLQGRLSNIINFLIPFFFQVFGILANRTHEPPSLRPA